MKILKNKTTKIILVISGVLMVVLLGCIIRLEKLAQEKWEDGIYFPDFYINAYCTDEPQIKANILIVGDEYLELAQVGGLECIIKGKEYSIPAECQLVYYCDMGKYYQAEIDIYPEIIVGTYCFDEIQLWNQAKCVVKAQGDFELHVAESNQTEEREKYDFSMVNWWMTESECEFIYEVVNRSSENMELLSLEGTLEEFKDIEVITIINNLDINEANIDFSFESTFTTPTIVEAKKKAYIRYVIPIQRIDAICNLLSYPALFYQTADEVTECVLIDKSCNLSILPITQEQVVEYIGERGSV